MVLLESLVSFITEHPFVLIMLLIFVGFYLLDFIGDCFGIMLEVILEYWYISIPILTLFVTLILYPFVGSIVFYFCLVIIGIVILAVICHSYIVNRGCDECHGEYYEDDDEKNDEPEEDVKSREEKRSKYKPSSSSTDITLDDIKGLDEAKDAIQYRVLMPLKNPDIYEKYGVKTGGGVLLYGLPGTGKTMFAQAMANELDACFFEIKCSDLMSKWYGESESNVKELFQAARKCDRAVIFFDEFEAIGKSRSSESNEYTIVPELLAQIQGFEKKNSFLLLLAATNRPWDIDSALLRPGRFNETIYIPLPDYESRLAIIKSQLKGLAIYKDISLESLAMDIDGFNGADVVELCDRMKMGPISRTIKNNSGKREYITTLDVESALSKVRSSVSLEDVQRMEEFRDRHD